MDEKQLQKLQKQLNSTWSLFAKKKQQKAAQTLAQANSAAAAEILAKTVSHTTNQQIHNTALTALQTLTAPQAIDAVCTVWVNSRHISLANLILKKQWQASNPLTIKILTALKSNHLNSVLEEKEAAVEIVFNAHNDDDPTIVENARKVLAHLQLMPQVQEKICQLVIENEHPLAQQIALTNQYAPADVYQRALFYLLTKQWSQYQSLDFDHSYIKQVYQQANYPLKQRITQQVRQAGFADLIKIMVEVNEQQPLTPTLTEEWETALNILTQQEQWPQIWQLSTKAPVKWSQLFLMQLKKAKWSPPNAQEALVFKELLHLAEQCQAQSPILKELIGQQTVLHGHLDRITCLTINSTGTLLITGGNDKSIRLWKLPEGKLLRNINKGITTVWGLGITPNDKLLAYVGGTGSRGYIVKLLRLPEEDILTILEGHERPILTLAISPNGQLLASGCRDKTVNVWQLDTKALIHTFQGHTDWVDCVVFSPDNELLVSSGHDNTVRLWSLTDGKLLKTLTKHKSTVKCLAISPDGKLLASAEMWEDRAIHLWELPQGTYLKSIKGHSRSVESLAITPDGQLLISGSADKTIKLWDLPEGTPITTLEGHEKTIGALAITADGSLLVSGSDDETARLWNLEAIRLSHIPIQQSRIEDITWLEKTLQQQDLPANERAWLTFILALIHNYRRFDIEVEDSVIEETFSPFDIEIEG